MSPWLTCGRKGFKEEIKGSLFETDVWKPLATGRFLLAARSDGEVIRGRRPMRGEIDRGTRSRRGQNEPISRRVALALEVSIGTRNGRPAPAELNQSWCHRRRRERRGGGGGVAARRRRFLLIASSSSSSSSMAASVAIQVGANSGAEWPPTAVILCADSFHSFHSLIATSYLVLPSFNKFHQVVASFTQLYLVVANFNKFSRVGYTRIKN